MQIIQARIEVIQSSIAAYKSTVGIPYLGPFLAPLAAAAAFTFGNIRVNNMKSEEFASGGILKGSRHSSGGIKTPYGELEGDEIVLTGNVGRNSQGRKMASDLNYAFGGRKFDTGGPINPLSRNNFVVPGHQRGQQWRQHRQPL